MLGCGLDQFVSLHTIGPPTSLSLCQSTEPSRVSISRHTEAKSSPRSNLVFARAFERCICVVPYPTRMPNLVTRVRFLSDWLMCLQRNRLLHPGQAFGIRHYSSGTHNFVHPHRWAVRFGGGILARGWGRSHVYSIRRCTARKVASNIPNVVDPPHPKSVKNMRGLGRCAVQVVNFHILDRPTPTTGSTAIMGESSHLTSAHSQGTKGRGVLFQSIYTLNPMASPLSCRHKYGGMLSNMGECIFMLGIVWGGRTAAKIGAVL